MAAGYHSEKIFDLMRAGGFYDNIFARDSSYDRVKEYLLLLGGKRSPRTRHDLQNPNYPCFPGLEHHPFHDGERPEGVRILEAAFSSLRREILNVPREAYLTYRPGKDIAGWTVLLIYHMGVNMRALAHYCPETATMITSLPRVCLDYPWGDALISVFSPQSSLKPHCSVDNLRLRCHLAVKIPTGCEIRVGRETREWTEGKALLFEDSIEHEVRNQGDVDRYVLIVDFWHPGLTDVEIAALTAGFRKSEVRRIFLHDRLKVTDAPETLHVYLDAEVERQDQDPLIREYWTR